MTDGTSAAVSQLRRSFCYLSSIYSFGHLPPYIFHATVHKRFRLTVVYISHPASGWILYVCCIIRFGKTYIMFIHVLDRLSQLLHTSGCYLSHPGIKFPYTLATFQKIYLSFSRSPWTQVHHFYMPVLEFTVNSDKLLWATSVLLCSSCHGYVYHCFPFSYCFVLFSVLSVLAAATVKQRYVKICSDVMKLLF